MESISSQFKHTHTSNLPNHVLWHVSVSTIISVYLVFLVCLYIIPPTPPPQAEWVTQGQFLSEFNRSEFSFLSPRPVAIPRLKSLAYYLPIAKRKTIGFIPFPRVLALCEMPAASSRIWTLVPMSISYDDNHCTTSNSIKHLYTTKILIMFVYM